MSVRVAQLLQMAVSTFYRPNASSWPGSPKDSDTVACRREKKTGLNKRRKKQRKRERRKENQAANFEIGSFLNGNVFRVIEMSIMRESTMIIWREIRAQ